jgi:adenosine kinase
MSTTVLATEWYPEPYRKVVFRVVSLLVAGSIATDHLMSFPGKFADSLVVDQLDKLSVSFLVEDLEVRRGGCAANICFGLGNLGLRPVLVGAVGEDFAEYRAWLERHNVDCGSVHVSETRHTARFVCTNDSAHAQIASFYAGAMSESREIELKPIVDRVGAPDYVLIGPDDPQGMLRHTEECRQRGYSFLADPSQQLAFGDGDLIRPLIDGAEILFSNEYEASLITQKTGWSAEEVLSRVGTWVVTLGPAGVRIDRAGEESIVVAAVPEIEKVEPTGVGDAFRAGFLAALSWGLGHERAAQLGCLLAVYVVEQVGTQEYEISRAAFLARCGATYGADAVADFEPHLKTIRA